MPHALDGAASGIDSRYVERRSYRQAALLVILTPTFVPSFISWCTDVKERVSHVTVHTPLVPQ